MKKVFFTVGPSQVYPTVSKHLVDAIGKDILSISHRESLFHEMYFENVKILKKLLKIPSDYQIFFIPSGTEGMELAIKNCVNDKSFHLITGAFGDKFFKIAKDLGKNSDKLSFDFEEGIDSDKLQNLNLSKYELLSITENDTSSGIVFPMEEVYKLKKKNKKLLIAVDSVSAVPFGNLKYEYLDLVFFSVQKGFGLPAGLGVMVVSPKAINKANLLIKQKKDNGSYHNLPTLLAYALKGETPETPNVLAMYLLNKVLSDMLSLGIERIRKETLEKAKLFYNFFEKSSQFKVLVKENAIRSQTTIVVETKTDSAGVISFCKTKGFIIGSGYGPNKNKHIRIGNFPAHTLRNVKNLIKILSVAQNA